MSSEFGLYRSGVYEKYFDDGAAVSADSQFWLPGHELHILGDINIGHTPIRLRAGGTKDNPIVVTSVGGVLSNYTDLLDTGVFTWTVVPTWSAQSYDGGSVVYHSGTDAYYTAIADITYSSSPADDPGTHVSWKDVGGKVYQCVLPAAYQKYLAYVEVNGDSTYSRRQIGNESAGGGTAGLVFYRIGEWAQGGPGLNYFAGYPDMESAPTHLYVRSDVGPENEAGITSMIGCFGFGAIEIFADGTYTPNHVLVEDLVATQCGHVVAPVVRSSATQNLLGTTVRRLTATRCGLGFHPHTYSNTSGGGEFAVREWLMEDCDLRTMGRGGVRLQNVGVGTVRGVSVIDYALQIGNGGIYANAWGSAGTSYDVPDPVYVEGCYVSQSGGLYAEQAGSAGNMFEDRGDAYYADGAVHNVQFSSGCIGETITQDGAVLCRTNNGGTTNFIGMIGKDVDQLSKISNSGNFTTYPKVVSIKHVSHTGITNVNSIVVVGTTNGTVNVTHVAAKGAGGAFIRNNDGAGQSTITSTDIRLEGIPTSAAGTTADITEANVTVTTGLFSSGVLPSTPLLRTATTDPLELVPAFDMTDAADRLGLTTGLTVNAPCVFALTTNSASHVLATVFSIGSGSDDQWRLLCDSGAEHKGRKRESTGGAANYDTGVTTGQAFGEEHRVAFRINANNTFDVWVDGTQLSEVSNYNDLDAITIIGAVLYVCCSWNGGAQGQPGQVRDLIIYEGLLTDAECIAL